MEIKAGDNYIIRTMTRSEVDFAVDLARREGWNPGLSDANCFYQTDPEGFLIGMLDNRPAGCISAVSYGQQFGFIGFYIVVPELRGKGYGLRLWQAAVQRLAGQNCGLDGVVAQEANYQKSGFKRAYRNLRFEYRASGLAEKRGSDIIDLRSFPLYRVAQYDRQCFPAERAKFLQCWLDQPASTALGILDEKRLKGYGVIRPCFQGYKIGPLFADDAVTAEKLFRSLASRAKKDEPVFLDVPEVNPLALKLAEKYHMTQSFATIRMYSGEQPAIALGRVFGNTTFELG